MYDRGRATKKLPRGISVRELSFQNSLSMAFLSYTRFSLQKRQLTSNCSGLPSATDDSHYYAGDHCRGMIMLEAEAAEKMGIVPAICAGKFYATQCPEVHLERLEDGKIHLTCTPVDRIVFCSNVVWVRDRVVRGKDLTEASYTPHSQDCFVRTEIFDAQGNCAWSNIIRLD